MTTTPIDANAPDVAPDSYVVLGLATCFLKEDGDVQQIQVVEPIPSAALEALMKGIPTSYQMAHATTIGAVLGEKQIQIPAVFPSDVMLGEDFNQRLLAATRTYQKRSQAKDHIAMGTTFQEFNYSTERKRLLNPERIVSAEDNVKQHAYTHQVL